MKTKRSVLSFSTSAIGCHAMVNILNAQFNPRPGDLVPLWQMDEKTDNTSG